MFLIYVTNMHNSLLTITHTIQTTYMRGGTGWETH
jgi:hypothetical protein